MKKDERFSVREFYEREWRPGKASKYIHSFYELKPGDKVMLCLCVSHRERKLNLRDQDANLRRHVRAKDGIVAGKHEYIGSRFDPCWIWPAVIKARRLGAKWMLAESTDRLNRHISYHSSERPHLQATDEQLKELVQSAGGVQLMTHLDPDAPAKIVRSYQRKRGQWAKGRKGGEPTKKRSGYKKRWRETKLPKVVLYWRLGLSMRQIQRKTGTPYSTVFRWIKRYGRRIEVF